MKRGTEQKLKFKKLRTALGGAPIWKVKGVLQSLWDFAADNCPHGDIGRFSDDDIALGIEWTDTCPSELIAALVDTGWLDRDGAHRLVIHDWHEHCEDRIKKLVARSGRPFAVADKTPADNGGQRPTPADDVCLPKPFPKPLPKPKPKPKDYSSEQDKPAHEPPTVWTPQDGWIINPQDRKDWEAAYPAVDIDRELPKMTAWLKANPKKAHKSNWARFAVNWLSKEQDRGGGLPSNRPPEERRTAEGKSLKQAIKEAPSG